MKYDDVLNDQRKVIFEQRVELMDAEDLTETIDDMRHELIDTIVRTHIPEKAYAEQWDVAGLKTAMTGILNLDLPIEDWAQEEGIAEDDIVERVKKAADEVMAEKTERFGPEIMAYIERSVLLQTIDNLWREHIVNLDHLRSVVGFRGYAQRDPLQEYKAEAFELFQALLANMREGVTAQMMRVEIVREAPRSRPCQSCMVTTKIRRPARMNLPPLMAWSPLRTAIPSIPRPGARLDAMKCVLAAPASASSIATAPCWRKTNTIGQPDALADFAQA